MNAFFKSTKQNKTKTDKFGIFIANTSVKHTSAVLEDGLLQKLD